MIAVAGLDPAIAGRVGYCAPNGTVHSFKATTQPSVVRNGTRVPQRSARLQEVRDRTMRLIRVNPPRPTLMLIEGYVQGVNAETTERLAEIGGVIRLALFEDGIDWVEVKPSSLKKFSTNDGRADKKAMIEAAIGLGAPATINEDQADAFHLRRMCLVALGLEPITFAWQSQSLADCRLRRDLEGWLK